MTRDRRSATLERSQDEAADTKAPGSQAAGGNVIDCAGAVVGGARRYLLELDRFLQGEAQGITVIGRGRALTARWLVEREAVATFRQPSRAIALNNASFVVAGASRTVLLGNALHFLDAEERARMPPRVVERLELQGGVVRSLLRRAHRIITPCREMAERVVARSPSAADRVEVMHHPLSVPSDLHHPELRRHRVFLCPILFAPYKRMAEQVRCVAAALAQMTGLERPAELWVTATAEELQAVACGLRLNVRALGRLRVEQVDALYSKVGVVVYPTEIEAYGYPLAEARLRRIPVVARDIPRCREIAGDALVPYAGGTSLRRALESALDKRLLPLDTNPFDPRRYFEKLFEGRPGRQPTD